MNTDCTRDVPGPDPRPLPFLDCGRAGIEKDVVRAIFHGLPETRAGFSIDGKGAKILLFPS